MIQKSCKSRSNIYSFQKIIMTAKDNTEVAEEPEVEPAEPEQATISFFTAAR